MEYSALNTGVVWRKNTIRVNSVNLNTEKIKHKNSDAVFQID